MENKKTLKMLFPLVMIFALMIGIVQTQAYTVHAADASTDEYIGYQSSNDYKYPLAVKEDSGDVVAYCFNAENEFPSWHEYKKISDADQTDLDKYSSNNPQKTDLIRTIYNGYPYNASGIKETYGLTDMQFQCVTQAAIWNYTDPNMITEMYYAYSGGFDSSIIQINKAKVYLAWNADGTNYFEWTSAMDDAFNALTNNTDNLATAPDYMSLDIYVSNYSYIQNLVTLSETPRTSLSLEVTKELTGRELKEGEFSFTLFDEEGNTIETVKNDADGKINFKEIEYTEAGTYTYTIKEVKGDLEGITYDENQIEVSVEVSDDSEGQLTAKVTYGEKTSFSNTYKEDEVKDDDEEPSTPSTNKGDKTSNTKTTKDTTSPKTGDSTNLALYGFVLVISLSAIVGLYIFRRRYNQ